MFHPSPAIGVSDWEFPGGVLRRPAQDRPVFGSRRGGTPRTNVFGVPVPNHRGLPVSGRSQRRCAPSQTGPHDHQPVAQGGRGKARSGGRPSPGGAMAGEWAHWPARVVFQWQDAAWHVGLVQIVGWRGRFHSGRADRVGEVTEMVAVGVTRCEIALVGRLSGGVNPIARAALSAWKSSREPRLERLS